MSEYFDGSMMVTNPYAVSAAQPMNMAEQNHHDSGNAAAAVSEARAIAEVKAQVLMARQFPRDPSVAFDRIMRECARPTLAEVAVYSFSRGKESVTGPSIRLAEVLARNWGNCNTSYEVIERKKNSDGVGISVVRAFAWDFETNIYISRTFEVKHWRDTRNGGYPLKDDRDIYELEANMASRRLRACILQMIPGDVTAAAVNACRMTESSGLSARMKDPNERAKLISSIVKAYAKMGVQQSDLEEKVNTNIDNWNADTMLKLKEMFNSIRDGVSSIEEFFPHLAANGRDVLITKDQVKALMEAAAKTGKQGEISDRMKEMGIAKFADTPATRYDEIMGMIQRFGTMQEQKAPDALEAPAQQTDMLGATPPAKEKVK